MATATDAADKADAAAGDVESGITAPIKRSLIVRTPIFADLIVGYVGITLRRTRVRSQF